MRHAPVLFARLDPTSSVIANGFSCSILLSQQVVAADVAVGDRLDPGDHVGSRVSPNRCAKRFCGRRYSSTGTCRRIFDVATTSPCFGLENREQAAFLGQPGDPDRVRATRSPSRAGRARGCACSGRRGTPSPACTLLRGRAGRRRSPSPRRGFRAPSRSSARSCPARTPRRALADRGRRRRAGGGRRRAGTLDAGVHVGLVVVADVEHVVVALEHPGQAGETDVDGAAVPALRRPPGRRCGP